MSLEPGRAVGNYEILDILRSTKDEVCYRVRNTLAQRVESMRVLGAAVASDPERTERFLREMRVHARLVHPNIPTFFGAFELERQLVATAELVEGVTLAELLLSGPLPWDEAAGIVLQLLAALGYAHSVGVIHRDVTAARLIITPEGVVKLTDFGLAKANTSPTLTQVGSIVGNLKYISPEQVRGTALVDPRSDLYSAGIVLYEAVTGRVPFDQKSQFELMAAQVGQPPAPPSTVNPRVSLSADAVILKALQKDPAARYQSAADFTAALADARAVARISVAVPVSVPAVAVDGTDPKAVQAGAPAVVEAAAPAGEPVPATAGPAAVPATVDACPSLADPVKPPASASAEPAAPVPQSPPATTELGARLPVSPVIGADEPQAAPATADPIPVTTVAAAPAPKPESVSPASHGRTPVNKAPEPVTFSVPAGSPASESARSAAAPLETSGIASTPSRSEAETIFSPPPGSVWGLREPVIYSALAVALVLVGLAAWLLTGNS